MSTNGEFNGFTTSLDSGFDLRDAIISGGDTVSGRIRALALLVDAIVPVPESWLSGIKEKRASNNSNGDILSSLPCTNYADLSLAWRKALKWTDGLDHALTVMLASITSTRSVGDQLWIKVLGPASCGKTTLCEAISVANKYVLAKSTIRGFHSGYDDGSGDDNSLLSKLRGKTLVTKDGDTLLQSPNLGQILSEARDIYDTVSRSSYRNKSSRDYNGVRMTWLLCGTSSLRSIDSSELGERFLDCVVMHGIDDDLEDEILLRVANRAEQSLSLEADGNAATHQGPEMTLAMQLTGGYVEYLREHAGALLSATSMSEGAKRYCTKLGKFVAYMRARPSKHQTENAEREFAARLVSQHVRLSKCLAVVLNRDHVDVDILNRTSRVTLDTSRGHTLDIVRSLYPTEERGLECKGICMQTSRTQSETLTMLRFLNRIGVVDIYVPKKGSKRYRLTERLRDLYSEVCDESQ